MRITRKKIDKYNRFLNRVKKTKDLRHISELINQYTLDNNNYMNTTSSIETNGYGDCNNDGGVSILDVVTLINFILFPTNNSNGNQILSRCAVRFNDETGLLVPSGSNIVNILDVINIITFILHGNDSNNLPPIEDEEQNTDLVVDDLTIEKMVYGYQYGEGDEYDVVSSFNSTNTMEYESSLDPYEYNIVSNGRVLITAPHAQRSYRPTSWEANELGQQSPQEGLNYCDNDGGDFPSCHKASDGCTGAMARTLSEITNSSYLSTRYKQEDPNYYDTIGIDFNNHNAEANINSGNSADPMLGFYNYGGLQTDFVYGQLHPFKQKLSQILDNNPQIKLVIDLHGSSATRHHWDVDFGLLGDNGNHGTLQLNLVDIGNNTINYSLLSEMVLTFNEHNIGVCDAVCDNPQDGAGYNCNHYATLDNGLINCDEGVPVNQVGHGRLSFNDLSAANQDSVTRYINQNHDGVHAIQLETSAIYRCGLDSNREYVIRYMRALQEIIQKANIYYDNMEEQL